MNEKQRLWGHYLFSAWISHHVQHKYLTAQWRLAVLTYFTLICNMNHKWMQYELCIVILWRLHDMNIQMPRLNNWSAINLKLWRTGQVVTFFAKNYLLNNLLKLNQRTLIHTVELISENLSNSKSDIYKYIKYLHILFCSCIISTMTGELTIIFLLCQYMSINIFYKYFIWNCKHIYYCQATVLCSLLFNQG
jgi:hypothetical protein